MLDQLGQVRCVSWQFSKGEQTGETVLKLLMNQISLMFTTRINLFLCILFPNGTFHFTIIRLICNVCFFFKASHTLFRNNWVIVFFIIWWNQDLNFWWNQQFVTFPVNTFQSGLTVYPWIQIAWRPRFWKTWQRIASHGFW